MSDRADPRPSRGVSALGEFIKSQRRIADLSQRELARLADLSDAYLSQLERGLHEPSVRVLKAIAAALNVSAESLLVQAGVLGTEAEDEPVTVEQAVNADPRLTEDQRAALINVYRSFVDDAG